MKDLFNLLLIAAALFLSVVIGVSHGVAAGLVCATVSGAALMPVGAYACLHSTGPWTLLDLAARSGRHVTTLIEGVLTMAPELSVTPAFPRAGLTYSTLTRTSLPYGDFAKVGAGVGLSKSDWKTEVGSMSKFEAQMRIPEDIVIASRSQDPELKVEDILADESMAYMKGSVNRIGSQFWYGRGISADGFYGLSTQVETSTNQVSAGGSDGADSSSVYLVYFDDSQVNPQGVHFVLGNGGQMQFSDTFLKQQIADPNDATKFMTAYTNSFLSYLGLVLPRAEAVYRVKNVTLTTNQGFTDAVAASLWQKVPLALRDKSKWRWFMNANGLYTLQASRATVSVATPGNKGVAGTGVFPDEPETCLGIRIIPTDSLLTTERAGLKP